MNSWRTWSTKKSIFLIILIFFISFSEKTSILERFCYFCKIFSFVNNVNFIYEILVVFNLFIQIYYLSSFMFLLKKNFFCISSQCCCTFSRSIYCSSAASYNASSINSPDFIVDFFEFLIILKMICKILLKISKLSIS